MITIACINRNVYICTGNQNKLQVYANIGLWCNGSTIDFGSVSDGSSPSSLTTDSDDSECNPCAIFG